MQAGTPGIPFAFDMCATFRTLCRFIRFARVSVDPKHRNVTACADWLRGHLTAIGLQEARGIPTPRHAIVCGACMEFYRELTASGRQPRR